MDGQDGQEGQFARLAPPPEIAFGWPTMVASPELIVTELAYGWEIRDDSKEWAIIIQMTYNQGGNCEWMVLLTQVDDNVRYSGGTTKYGCSREVGEVNRAIRNITVDAKWIHPMNMGDQSK